MRNLTRLFPSEIKEIYIMKYSELSKTQKVCIDTFIAKRPELASAVSISRTEVEELWELTYADRDNGGSKFGYPMWLVKGPKVARGVYVFPGPNVTNEVATVQVKNAKRKKKEDGDDSIVLPPEEEAEFQNDLKEFGITV